MKFLLIVTDLTGSTQHWKEQISKFDSPTQDKGKNVILR